MRHIITSEDGRPGMTLDELEEAIGQARRSGAVGTDAVRARRYRRGGGLRSITVTFSADPRGSARTERPNRA